MLFDQSHHMVELLLQGTRRAQARLRHGDQQRRELPGQPGQAVRPVHAGRPRDRRRHPVPPRRGRVRVGRPRAGRQLAPLSTPRPAATSSTSSTTTARPRARTGKAVTRKYWRFQIQGPNAWQVIEKLNGGPVEQLKFFRMAEMNDGRPAGAHAASRHGGRARARAVGSVRGPRRDARRDPRGGQGFRPRAGGARAYASNTLESGWIPSPLPADLYRRGVRRSYREWLPADSYEANNALAGSFVSDNIEDYYLNPWRARLRPVRQVRPRLHRPRCARADRCREPSARR